MAERNQAVLDLVEERLRKNPDASTGELKEAAEKVDESIRELTAREFNARYPLQVRRRMAAREEPSGNGDSPEPAKELDEETKERVYEVIEEALREDPDVSNDVLRDRAAEIAPSVRDLSARSFNARYPLQVKRRLSAERDERKPADAGRRETARRGELRAAVRSALVSFARDVAAAEDRGEVVEIALRIDDYVDEVMKSR